MAEILIVDDERVLREGLKAMLTGEGFAVRTARDGVDALKKMDERRTDLVLLDVMMPKMNGFLVCAEMRKRDPLVPIIFLTAKDSEADQVRGIGLGADDYVSKSAGDAVLLARIHRALARASTVGDALAKRDESAAAIVLGAISVDVKTLVVSADGRELARLTKTEFDILRLLDSERGRSFGTDEIITALRGTGFACVDTMLYTHISNLRHKLGPAADMLTHLRGIGYSIVK